MPTPLANLQLKTDSNGYLLVSGATDGTVHVAAAGALMGDGSVATPLAVAVDGSSIVIVGNQLTAPTGGSGTVTHTGTLAANAIVLGNGTADIKTTTTAAGVVTFLGTPTSANLASAVTDETGSGALVFATSPTLVTPALGTPASGVGTNLTGIPEGGLALTDITTNNASTSKHGFLLKLDNNAAHFMNGQGAWATPAGSGTPQILAAYVAKTANYTAVVATDGVIETKTNAIDITLPTAVGIAGQGFIIINQQTANAATIKTTSGQTVNGQASGSVTITNGALMILSDGANYVIGSDAGLTIPSLTSGGVIYASSTSALASSALLAANGVVVGGGAGTAPATISPGTSGAWLVSAGSGAVPVMTVPSMKVPVMFNMGATIAGTASLGVSTPGSGGATAATAATTVPPIGVASFSGSASNEVHCQFWLPSDWTASSAFDVDLYWRAAATSGNVNWQVASLFVADAVVLNTAYNTASTVADTAKGTTLQLNKASITAITASGTTTPAANTLACFKILRDGGSGADTMSGAAELIGACFYYRRTPVLGA